MQKRISPNVQCLLARYPIISDQVNKHELEVILNECEAALGRTSGDVVEFGCYIGTTSLFIMRLLQTANPYRTLHVYDSFKGLPEKTPEDNSPAGEQFKAAELRASKYDFVRRFKQAGLPLPVIHRGWFQEFSGKDVPEKLCFAFLDGDYYASIKASLQLVWPCLAPGACVVVDDYQNEALPGVQHAVDEWCSRHNATVQPVASLAIISPKL